MSEPVPEVEGGSSFVSEVAPVATASAVPFFLIGTRKFVAMSVVTLGLYQIYWFYQQWRQLRDVGGEDIWPIPRTLLSGFFSYWLFDRVREESDRQGVPGLLSPLLLAALYFVALTCRYLGAPVWAPLLGTVAILACVQARINTLPAAQHSEPARQNARFTKLNWAGAAVFAACTILVLLPDTSPLAVPDEGLRSAARSLELPQALASGVWLDEVDVSDHGLTFHVRVEGQPRASRLDDLGRDLVRLACQGGGLPTQALTQAVPVHFTLMDDRRVQQASRSVLRRSDCPLFD